MIDIDKREIYNYLKKYFNNKNQFVFKELSDQELKIIQFIRSLTPEEGKLFEKHCLDYGVFLITRKRADQYNISCQSDHVC